MNFWRYCPIYLGKDQTADNLSRWLKTVSKLATWKFPLLSGKYDEECNCNSSYRDRRTDARFCGNAYAMYLRYAERMEFEATVMDKSDGDEAGIKSCLMVKDRVRIFEGRGGVHRLVRLSPFNSKYAETSFVLVEILPEIHFSKK